MELKASSCGWELQRKVWGGAARSGARGEGGTAQGAGWSSRIVRSRRGAHWRSEERAWSCSVRSGVEKNRGQPERGEGEL